MKSVPQHLLSEDRQEYERILGEALRSAPHRPELAAGLQRLNPEQLRTMALNATAIITTAAATEYQHYVKVREELRHSASPFPLYESSGTAYSSAPAPSAFARSDTRSAATAHRASSGLGRRLGSAVLGTGQPGGYRTSGGVSAQRWAGMSYGRRLLAAVLGLRVRPEVSTAAGTAEASAPAPETTQASGSGAIAVFAAPAAVLSGTVAAILFLVGLALKIFSAEMASARTITAGWLFGAATVGTIVVWAVVLLITALRSRDRSARESAGYREVSEKVARARQAWQEALLERGILPFLRDALAAPDAAALRHHTAPPTPTSRIPQLGYGHPVFNSPDEGAPGQRPSFASPDYTSPDFGGPEHEPE